MRFQIGDLLLGHKTHHLAARHFGEGAFLLHTAVADFTEAHCDHAIVRAAIRTNGAGVFFRSQIENDAIARIQRIIQTAAPIGIEIPCAIAGELCLHFQAIRHNRIERPQHPIHA